MRPKTARASPFLPSQFRQSPYPDSMSLFGGDHFMALSASWKRATASGRRYPPSLELARTDYLSGRDSLQETEVCYLSGRGENE